VVSGQYVIPIVLQAVISDTRQAIERFRRRPDEKIGQIERHRQVKLGGDHAGRLTAKDRRVGIQMRQARAAGKAADLAPIFAEPFHNRGGTGVEPWVPRYGIVRNIRK
jgi:hypothetical protein